jgi:chaperonin GroES
MLKPLHDNIIIKEQEPEEQSVGGVHLPQLRRVLKREGTVIAVGPGKRMPDHTLIPVSVRPGDHVMYDSLSGTIITFKDEKYIVISDKSLLVISA